MATTKELIDNMRSNPLTGKSSLDDVISYINTIISVLGQYDSQGNPGITTTAKPEMSLYSSWSQDLTTAKYSSPTTLTGLKIPDGKFKVRVYAALMDTSTMVTSNDKITDLSGMNLTLTDNNSSSDGVTLGIGNPNDKSLFAFEVTTSSFSSLSDDSAIYVSSSYIPSGGGTFRTSSTADTLSFAGMSNSSLVFKMYDPNPNYRACIMGGWSFYSSKNAMNRTFYWYLSKVEIYV